MLSNLSQRFRRHQTSHLPILICRQAHSYSNKIPKVFSVFVITIVIVFASTNIACYKQANTNGHVRKLHQWTHCVCERCWREQTRRRISLLLDACTKIADFKDNFVKCRDRTMLIKSRKQSTRGCVMTTCSCLQYSRASRESVTSQLVFTCNFRIPSTLSTNEICHIAISSLWHANAMTFVALTAYELTQTVLIRRRYSVS